MLTTRRAAIKLSKEFPEYEIVLIDAKDYFENTIAVLTCLTHVEISSSVTAAMKIVMRHDHYLVGSNIRIVKELVKEVTPTKVILSNETIYFDYLILACGTSYRSTIKDAQNLTTEFRVQSLTRDASDLASADSVLIVGGGLVGVELAAEIVTSYPNKKLTLVTAGDRLLERMKPNVSAAAHKWLSSRGVDVVFGERVRQSKKDPTAFRFPKSGASVTPVKAYWCTGFQPNSGLLQKNFSSSLNKDGYVKVNDFMQVVDVEAQNIFAIGDLADLPEEKMAERAWAHAKFVVKCMRTLAKEEPLKKKYKPPTNTPLMVISLGPDNALLCRNRSLTTQGSVAGTFKRYVFRMMMVKQAKALKHLADSVSSNSPLYSRLSLDHSAFMEKNPSVAIAGDNIISADLAMMVASMGSQVHYGAQHDIDRNIADNLGRRHKRIHAHHVDPKIPVSALAALKGCTTAVFTYMVSTHDPVEMLSPYFEAIKMYNKEGTLKRLIVVHPGYRLERAPQESILGSKLRQLEEVVKGLCGDNLIVTYIRFAPTYDMLKVTAPSVIEHRVVKFAMPSRGLPFLASSDVRDSIIRVLAQPEAHDNRVYSLCGDDRVTGQDIAEAISVAVSSKEIDININFEKVAASQLTAEFIRLSNTQFAPALVDWFDNSRHMIKMTDDLSAVLENASIPLAEWVQLNEHLFI